MKMNSNKKLPQCTSLLYSHEECCILYTQQQLLGSHKQTNILNMQFVHEEKYTVFTSNLSRKEWNKESSNHTLECSFLLSLVFL